MRPIRYKNGTFPTNGVLAPCDLASFKDTPLDPNIEEHGADIILPSPCLDWNGREIKKVFFPPLGAIREEDTVIVLNPIQGAAQNLLVAVEEFKQKDIEVAQLTRALHSYQRTVISQLFGRGGMISKFIMTSRMKRSGRAVLLPRAGGDPFVCEIPAWMMKSLQLKNGDYVVVGRDPTIWEGGIEVLRATSCDSNVIRLHPLVFAQLNADCDGDAVWVLAIPRHLKKEAEEHLGSFMRRTAKWPKPYNLDGEEVDWESAEYDMSYRAAPTGFSVGPEDILNNSEALKLVEKITGKELAAECLATARGLSNEEWKRIVLKVNRAQLLMKVGMGPVGSAAMAVRVLAGENLRARRSASLISERLEQKLLDSKRAKDAGDSYSHTTALDILQMRNEWAKANKSKAVNGLAKCLGLKASDVRPIINLIWDKGQGLSAIMLDEYPFFASTIQAAENYDQAVVLAERIFIHKSLETSGLARFIVETLAERKETEDAITV